MTTPRIRGASARDVTEARELLRRMFYSEPDMELTSMFQNGVADIAAALAERERWAVEACCGAVCLQCSQGIRPDKGEDGSYWHRMGDYTNVECKASAIRADAARRETP